MINVIDNSPSEQKEQTSNYALQVEEIENILKDIPQEFNDIKKEIDRSKYILGLEDGRDDDNKGKKIAPLIRSSSVKFLVNIALQIYQKHGKILSAPEINPCSDQSIDISRWTYEPGEEKKYKSRLLVNIKQDGDKIMAYFYGDLEDKTSEIRGQFSINEISSDLITRMCNLEK